MQSKHCPVRVIVLAAISLTIPGALQPLRAQAQQPQIAVPNAQELDQLLAPVALYPDALLAQVTAASTNPQEVLDVSGWVRQNSSLTGDALVNGKLARGFAIVAYPVEYGASGVMTFIVDRRSKVYQKDLGPETASLAKRMTAFDPDRSWKVTE